MALPRILITRSIPVTVEARLAGSYDTTFSNGDRPLSQVELESALREYDAIVPTITDRIDARMLGIGGIRTKILANFGAGTEHIDLAAAASARLAVTNTPDALTETTAELAITLILMIARRAGEGERELRAGRWTGWRPTHMLGAGLQGKLLGLVGFGRIAQATARRAAAFGMRIAYYSRTRASTETEARLGARHFASLEALAREADVLSIHVPGGEATRHLINAEMLARMPRRALLINTARGSIIDENALATALEERTITGAALDVYEREPLVNPRLLALENIVLLPHLGSATLEARTAMGMQAADNLDAYFAGRPLPNRVA